MQTAQGSTLYCEDKDMNNRPKRILLLGASGSIGRQTLDVIEQHPELFTLAGLAAGHQAEFLKEAAQRHPEVQVIGIADESQKELLQETGLPVFAGEEAMSQCIAECDYDILVNAVVGFRGLKPTLDSLYKGKSVALANKESLVAGGELVQEALKATGTGLYPIDSEHSAIFQCLQNNKHKDIRRLIITASGGSFRNRSRDELKDVTPAQALAHPNWNMGSRITLDSATMVNKGFEVIEAHYLFDVPYEQIDTVLHDESIVHSMVEYQDHAILAQLGSADMHLPIQYALTVPGRPPLEEKSPLDMCMDRTLHFRKMDFERFPMLKTAYECGRARGNRGAVFNGADEQAVALFLQEKISFLEIEEAILYALDQVKQQDHPSYEDLVQADAAAREAVLSFAEAKASQKNSV